MTDFVTLAERILPSDAKVERAPSPAEVEEQNNAALAQLESMLAGVR